MSPFTHLLSYSYTGGRRRHLLSCSLGLTNHAQSHIQHNTFVGQYFAQDSLHTLVTTCYVGIYNNILIFILALYCTFFVCVNVHIYIYTSSTRVNRREELIVEIWLIQLAKRLKLQLSILEEIQFGEKCQTYKPELE